MNISRSDILVILPLGLLLVIGLVMVTSSSIYIADDMTSNPFHFEKRQALFISVGIFSMIFFLILPSDFLRSERWPYKNLPQSLNLQMMDLDAISGPDTPGFHLFLG